MSYRNRKLLDLARLLQCQAGLIGCSGGPCEPAHSDHLRHGKGKGEKAQDMFFASLCHNCHDKIGGQVSGLTREERRDAWTDAFERTLVALWARGLICVTGTKPTSAPHYQPPPKIVSREPPSWKR